MDAGIEGVPYTFDMRQSCHPEWHRPHEPRPHEPCSGSFYCTATHLTSQRRGRSFQGLANIARFALKGLCVHPDGSSAVRL